MNRNEWFIECTGMVDLMNEEECMIHWMNDSLNEQEWFNHLMKQELMIHWLNRNGWMNDSLNEQEWMIH